MSEGALIRAVTEEGALTQRELADRLFIGRAGAGQLIDRMEARGLVRRDTDPIDRRVWRISATKAGWAIAAQFGETYADIRRELRSGLSPADRDRLADALHLVQANALRLAGDEASTPEAPTTQSRPSRASRSA
jgi:DNA-binding MarR family transcriptional regulator